MNASRGTPAPATWECRSHSGLMERVRDLEERAGKASEERRDIVKQITDIRVSIAKWMGGLAVALVIVQIATAVILKVM